MKAAVYDRYGPADVVTLKDRPDPVPGAGDVLIEVHASTVTTADWRMRASDFPRALWLPGRLIAGLFRPRHPVLGGDFAGRVIATGAKVTRFAPGDRVFGFSLFGAHAERLVVKETGAIARMPDSLSYADAAALPFGALAALGFLRDFARVRPGERVLITGASGGVGAMAVQIARHLGAHVTAVAGPDNQDFLRELGAEATIDYRSEDFTAREERWDVILDIVGARPLAETRRVLTPTGRHVYVEFGLRAIGDALLSRLRSGPKAIIGVSGDKAEDVALIGDLAARGILRPVIGASLPLAQIAEAHRLVETRHKRGSVVVTMGETSAA